MLSLGVALSGMQAASLRLAAAGGNIANMNSYGALPAAGQAAPAGSPQPYQPVQAVQAAAGPSAGGGTTASLSPISPASVPQYDPQSSYANAQGLVAAPNVNLQTEVVNMVIAKSDFSANVSVAQSVNNMVKQLFELGD